MSMKKLPALVATTAFALGLAGLATAQTPATERLPTSAQAIDRHFDEMDTNNDGRLTRDQINPELRLHREFDRYDTDNNGVITLDEFRVYVREAQEHQR